MILYRSHSSTPFAKWHSWLPQPHLHNVTLCLLLFRLPMSNTKKWLTIEEKRAKVFLYICLAKHISFVLDLKFGEMKQPKKQYTLFYKSNLIRAQAWNLTKICWNAKNNLTLTFVWKLRTAGCILPFALKSTKHFVESPEKESWSTARNSNLFVFTNITFTKDYISLND